MFLEIHYDDEGTISQWLTLTAFASSRFTLRQLRSEPHKWERMVATMADANRKRNRSEQLNSLTTYSHSLLLAVGRTTISAVEKHLKRVRVSLVLVSGEEDVGCTLVL